MKKYVYPAIIYYDSESEVYVLVIEELALCVEGDSVEQVHEKAGVYLQIYVNEAIKEDIEITTPRDFNQVATENPKQICVLVECLAAEATKDNS